MNDLYLSPLFDQFVIFAGSTLMLTSFRCIWSEFKANRFNALFASWVWAALLILAYSHLVCYADEIERCGKEVLEKWKSLAHEGYFFIILLVILIAAGVIAVAPVLIFLEIALFKSDKKFKSG